MNAVLFALAAAVAAEAVVAAAAAFHSWRRSRPQAGLSAEDQLARVVTIAAAHPAGCPWETAAFSPYMPDGARWAPH